MPLLMSISYRPASDRLALTISARSPNHSYTPPSAISRILHRSDILYRRATSNKQAAELSLADSLDAQADPAIANDAHDNRAVTFFAPATDMAMDEIHRLFSAIIDEAQSLLCSSIDSERYSVQAAIPRDQYRLAYIDQAATEQAIAKAIADDPNVNPANVRPIYRWVKATDAQATATASSALTDLDRSCLETRQAIAKGLSATPPMKPSYYQLERDERFAVIDGKPILDLSPEVAKLFQKFRDRNTVAIVVARRNKLFLDYLAANSHKTMDDAARSANGQPAVANLLPIASNGHSSSHGHSLNGSSNGSSHPAPILAPPLPPRNSFERWRDQQLALRGVSLADYQRLGARNCMDMPYYALLWEPGTGKTITAISGAIDYACWEAEHRTIGKKKAHIIVLMPKSLMTNWAEELEQFSCYSAFRPITYTKPDGSQFTEYERDPANDKLYVHKLAGNGDAERLSNLLAAYMTAENIGKHLVVLAGYETFVATPMLRTPAIGAVITGTSQTQAPTANDPNDLVAAMQALMAQSDKIWDALILDESHSVKSPSTTRTKTVLAFKDQAKKRFILTGTVVGNAGPDVWAQMEVLEHGVSGFATHSNMCDYFEKFSTGRDSKSATLDQVPLVKSRIAQSAFIITKAQVLPNLPQRTKGVIKCDMTPAQWDVYRKVLYELHAEIDGYLASSGDHASGTLTVNNALTKTMRLLQITSGILTPDKEVDADGIPIGNVEPLLVDPNPRIAILHPYLFGYGDNEAGFTPGVLSDENAKVVLWTAFVPNLKQLKAWFDNLALPNFKVATLHGGMNDAEKQRNVDMYNNDPQCRVFIGMQQAGGVGLNLVGYNFREPVARHLPTNSVEAIYFSTNYSRIQRAQSADRVHRKNTRRPVKITEMLVPATVDVLVSRILKHKDEIQMSLTDIRAALRELM